MSILELIKSSLSLEKMVSADTRPANISILLTKISLYMDILMLCDFQLCIKYVYLEKASIAYKLNPSYSYSI